jgi:hypothetical protein
MFLSWISGFSRFIDVISEFDISQGENQYESFIRNKLCGTLSKRFLKSFPKENDPSYPELVLP